MSIVPSWMEVAIREIGVAEIPGPQSEKKIDAYLSTVGIHDGDETSWCSAFCNWIMLKSGIAGTGKPNARSWLGWGKEVKLPYARIGDVVVLWRESPSSWMGHVGILVGFNPDGNLIYLLGGNQGDRVSIAAYDADRVLGIRRPVVKTEVSL